MGSCSLETTTEIVVGGHERFESNVSHASYDHSPPSCPKGPDVWIRYSHMTHRVIHIYYEYTPIYVYRYILVIPHTRQQVID
jgi:hypothetical protein